MATKIPAAQLQPGDVLLYHGTALISRLIRLFDGGQYSHASIYNGEEIVEALGSGVEHDPVAQSVKNATYVDVYRFYSNDGQPLGSDAFPAQPVLARIAWYVANHNRYAYQDILLLALLASSRRIPVISWIPGLNLVIRQVLDHAAEVLSELAAAGREPVICSELVYRCFGEAQPPGKFELKIVGADVLAAAQAVHLLDALANAGTATGAAAIAPPLDSLQAEKQLFLTRYAALKQRAAPTAGTIAAARATGGAAAAAVAQFVTPHDLEVSRNLRKLGTLTT